jgi:hypothetical protein
VRRGEGRGRLRVVMTGGDDGRARAADPRFGASGSDGQSQSRRWSDASRARLAAFPPHQCVFSRSPVEASPLRKTVA